MVGFSVNLDRFIVRSPFQPARMFVSRGKARLFCTAAWFATEGAGFEMGTAGDRIRRRRLNNSDARIGYRMTVGSGLIPNIGRDNVIVRYCSVSVTQAGPMTDISDGLVQHRSLGRTLFPELLSY